MEGEKFRFGLASRFREKLPSLKERETQEGMAGEDWGERCSGKAQTAGTKKCGSHETPLVIRVLLSLVRGMEGRRKLQQTEMILWRQAGGVNGARATPAGCRHQSSGEPQWVGPSVGHGTGRLLWVWLVLQGRQLRILAVTSPVTPVHQSFRRGTRKNDSKNDGRVI
jgi:hypothetical protein